MNDNDFEDMEDDDEFDCAMNKDLMDQNFIEEQRKKHTDEENDDDAHNE